MQMGIRIWGWLVLTTLVLACGSQEQERSATGDELQATIDSLKGTDYFTRLELRAGQQRELEGFYRDLNYEPAWNQADSKLPTVDSLLVVLNSAAAEGLDLATYQVHELRRLRETAERDTTINREKILAQLDLPATSEYLKYDSHLLAGRIDPHALATNWLACPRQVDLNAHLRKALQSKTIRQSLLELLSTHRQYGLLKAQLARYRAAPGEVAGTTSGMGTLSAGHLSDDQLQKRLAFYGLADTAVTIPAAPGQPDHLGLALKQFQQLNGLNTTGVVDDSTRAALNRPITDVIQTLPINMERIRWQLESLGDRYVAVNVPSSKLKVYENGVEAVHMRVIVGNEYAVTPIFTDMLEYTIFSPDWTIPLTLARKEMLPILQRNPNYLQERNMVLYDSWDTVQAKQLDPREIDWRKLSPRSVRVPDRAETGGNQPNGTDEVHAAQPAVHLPARYAGVVLVRVEEPRPQPRLHPGEAARRTGQLPAGGQQRLERRQVEPVHPAEGTQTREPGTQIAYCRYVPYRLGGPGRPAQPATQRVRPRPEATGGHRQ
jgi:murein L,D-transpeptidase YcbB/YkuD